MDTADLSRLPVSEKLKLVTKLWDDIASSCEEIICRPRFLHRPSNDRWRSRRIPQSQSMMRNFGAGLMGTHRRYHPGFADDLSAATAYYDKISVDLGNRFREVVRRRLVAITENPELSGRIHEEIRVSMVDRFPYVIVFEILGNAVVMLGIHHAASNQGGWFQRSTT